MAGLRDQGDSLQELIQAQLLRHLFSLPSWTQQVAGGTTPAQNRLGVLPLCIPDILGTVGNSLSAFIVFISLAENTSLAW